MMLARNKRSKILLISAGFIELHKKFGGAYKWHNKYVLKCVNKNYTTSLLTYNSQFVSVQDKFSLY